ncbi:protein-lysine methyltransferase METTL21D isoform X2 [Ananas comosus]|nr:protein-lysine methyltransferase METTL21D isoform X2 [Ananas comosus]
MVFVKYLEKNCRKGRFSPSKLKGKRVIELGAGCGLAGLGMALLGCDVITTDQVEVLPLLMRNVERNTSWILQANSDSAPFGSISVAELDWGNKEHIKSVGPPFDYIIGTDVVYSEHLLEPLMQTILALSGPRTSILLGYEIRSTTVHEQMMQMWKNNFIVKSIPKSKMDNKYQHPSIQLFMMEPKAQQKCGDDTCTPSEVSECGRGSDEGNESGEAESEKEGTAANPIVNGKPVGSEKRELDDWEIRRYGAMVARLMQDIKIT